MKTVYSDLHREHRIEVELHGNALVPCFEKPDRADAVLREIVASGIGAVIAPVNHGRESIISVHAPDYVDFLEVAWRDWIAAGEEGDAFSGCTPMADMSRRVPASIHGRLGYYSFDSSAPITAGTWTAAYAAAQVALTATDLLVDGEPAAFALCRPPGHHASRAYFGGYCYLNNAAIAAQSLLDRGVKRVAVLDIDFHHGNGTQSIFYERSDVFFASIHGDPHEEYPYFSGHAEETGSGPGAGCNLNLPLPPGTGTDRWLAALDTALSRIRSHGAEVIVVSLGVDTFERDPISSFKLRSEDYLRAGAAIGSLRLPALFALEGGYALDAIGVNVVNTLAGFEA
jgi:acetoin utilization deacetylase AcuC-like enzyme